MTINVLFLIPDILYIDDYQKSLYYNDIPIGTLQISAFLRTKLDINTEIIDFRIENEKNSNLEHKNPDLFRYKQNLVRILESYGISKYDYIGISCYTSFQYLFSKYIAEVLKKKFPHKILFTGGYHPTAQPKDFIYKGSPFNFIIKGEGERALLELLKNGKKRKNNIENKRTSVIKAEKVIDINKLPFPDYATYLNNYPYKDRFKFEIYCSRGCPYQCAFCAKNFKFRCLNFDAFKPHFDKLCNLIREYNPHISKLIFADQSFNKIAIKKKLIEYIEKKNLYEEFMFSCQSRVENLTKSHEIERLRKNNFLIGFGFESADFKLLKEMHKTNDPTSYVKKMTEILKMYNKDNGPYCRINILAGFPGESSVSFEKTVSFLQENVKSPQIQISPTLFSNYPNIFAYHQMGHFEKKFGTRFIKNWWKMRENQLKVSVPYELSKNYSLISLLCDYKEKYFPLLRQFEYKNIFALIMWKRYYDNWYNDLKSQKIRINKK
ncbi:MAG: B12-binding domain-containing radical SAM protein [archaeon]